MFKSISMDEFDHYRTKYDIDRLPAPDRVN
jgi:hypothetical protein